MKKKFHVAIINHVERLEALTFSDRMNTFLTEELLPRIQAKFHVYQEMRHATITGFGFGSLGAFYAALQHSIFKWKQDN